MSPPPDATSPPDATTQPPDPTSQPPRRYASQVRDEQARRTRRAIVTAAHDLFLAQGYAATTIDGIAEAAHASRRTVFNSVGGKVALLKLALDWAIVGDDEPIALADRPAIKAILAESDPRKALMLWVQTVSDSPPAPAAWRSSHRRRQYRPGGRTAARRGERQPDVGRYRVHPVSRVPGRTGRRHDRATCRGTLLGAHDGHLYRQLVPQRSWSTADFNLWLADSLAAALLPPELTAAGVRLSAPRLPRVLWTGMDGKCSTGDRYGR